MNNFEDEKKQGPDGEESEESSESDDSPKSLSESGKERKTKRKSFVKIDITKKGVTEDVLQVRKVRNSRMNEIGVIQLNFPSEFAPNNPQRTIHSQQ